MNKRAIIYGRVSTDDQRGNYSIPTQVAECVKYIHKHGYTLVGGAFVDPDTGYDTVKGPSSIPAYIDDYTSREISRPSLDASLSYLEEYGFDVVVILSIDRLARDPYIRQTLEREYARRGAKAEYVIGNYDETPEGDVRKDLDATFAKWENSKRLERFNRGKIGKAGKNLFVGGRTPYGYILDKSEFGGVKIDEQQAEVVQLIYRLYIDESFSLHSIVKELEQLCVPTYTGRPKWCKSMVRRILKNTAYIGYVFYNKSKAKHHAPREIRAEEDWIKIQIPPLVTQEMYDLAQARLENNLEAIRRHPTHSYLLGGMVRCGECQRPYNANFHNDRPRTHRKAYSSYIHRASSGHCCNREIRARLIEPLVWDKIVEFMLNPEKLEEGYEDAYRSEIQAQARRRALLEEMHRSSLKFEQQLANLTRAYTDPDIQMTKSQYLAQKVQIESELAALKSRINETEAHLSNLPTRNELEELKKFSARFKTERTELYKLNTKR